MPGRVPQETPPETPQESSVDVVRQALSKKKQKRRPSGSFAPETYITRSGHIRQDF